MVKIAMGKVVGLIRPFSPLVISLSLNSKRVNFVLNRLFFLWELEGGRGQYNYSSRVLQKLSCTIWGCAQKYSRVKSTLDFACIFFL